MKILVSGANRGLGLSILRSLIQQLPLNSQHQLYVTARNRDNLTASINTLLPSMPNNIELHPYEFKFSDATCTTSLLEVLPELNHIFHTAAPYARTPIMDASVTEREEFLAFSNTEETFLIEGVKKLRKGGSLVAAGAIICETVNLKVPNSHPWHCGLSSIQKAHLRSIMGAINQEVGSEYKIIHANLGTFVEPKGNEEQIADGKVLAIDEVANALTNIALSDKHPPDFNIDILSRAEHTTLCELRSHSSVNYTTKQVF